MGPTTLVDDVTMEIGDRTFKVVPDVEVGEWFGLSTALLAKIVDSDLDRNRSSFRQLIVDLKSVKLNDPPLPAKSRGGLDVAICGVAITIPRTSVAVGLFTCLITSSTMWGIGATLMTSLAGYMSAAGLILLSALVLLGCKVSFMSGYRYARFNVLPDDVTSE